LEKSTRLPQAPSQSFYLLGQANLQAGKYADAKKSFQQATVLLPDHTQAYFGLFTACAKLGQAEEAQRYRERFMALEAADRRSHSERTAREDTLGGLPLVRSTVARTLFGAGQIYRVHQQLAKAAELLRKAASLDEANGSYRAALESLYLQQKAPAEGVAAFQQLVVEQPKNPLNYLFLGRFYARLNQVDSTEQAYRKVQELAPEWSEGYRALAELNLRADRKVPEARQMAEKAVKLDPSGPNYYLLGFACAKVNDKAGAIDAIKRAVAAEPGEKKYRDLLRQLEQAP
jgi:cytochrome c-type biogenesis protein CcmH/NrfG